MYYYVNNYAKLQVVAHVMSYTNACLNPILYAMMSKNFRCGFCQVREIQENYVIFHGFFKFLLFSWVLSSPTCPDDPPPTCSMR